MTFLDALQILAADPATPLNTAEVALLFAQDEYPGLDRDYYLTRIDQIAFAASATLSGDLESRTSAFASFLFDAEAFTGNTSDYYDPRNSYLNDVLDRRTGIPISLSVLAMIVGERAGLPVGGVGLPGHFIAKAVEGSREVFFDPFHGGQLLSPAACARLVEAVTGHSVPLDDLPLESSSLGAIVARMLNNLKGIYLQRGDFPRAVRVIERLRIFDPEDVLQRRDLGVALVHAGRSGAAIDHLESYLAKHTQGEDIELVTQVLKDAKNEVLRWN